MVVEIFTRSKARTLNRLRPPKKRQTILRRLHRKAALTLIGEPFNVRTVDDQKGWFK
jgi:hypothetical protein